MSVLTDKQLSTIFSEAADLIERTGWTQGKYESCGDNPKCYCAAGAMRAVGAQVLDTNKFDAIRAIDSALGRDDLNKIIRYNDTPRRRKSTVVRYLRKRAEEFANRG